MSSALLGLRTNPNSTHAHQKNHHPRGLAWNEKPSLAVTGTEPTGKAAIKDDGSPILLGGGDTGIEVMLSVGLRFEEAKLFNRYRTNLTVV